MRGVSIGLLVLAVLAGCSSGADRTAGAPNATEPARNDSVPAPPQEDRGVPAIGPAATAGVTGLPAGYRARGQEPGWLLTIDKGRIDYVGNYGETRIDAALPAPTVEAGGVSYVTPELVVRVRFRRCNDAMSGQGFADEVEVTTRDKTYTGCGGERRPEWDM